MTPQELLEFTKQVGYESEETLALAKRVADMPPEANDLYSIREWAKRLAADISKGRD